MKRTFLILVGVVVSLLVGRWSVGWGARGSEPQPPTELAEAVTWICPMHPQIQLPEFGSCPICGMDLVPREPGDDDPRRLSMTPADRELARIATRAVERKNVIRPVRMFGKVDYDETAVRTISAWVPGRLDRLFVDYMGVRVEEGDHLVWLYSPDLLSAQDELLSALQRTRSSQGEASEFLTTSNRRTYAAAREKLLLLGLTEKQVDEIEERGTAEDHVMLTSPSTGVVIDKFVDQGAYVQTGTRIYRVANMSHLWIRLDAYEQDLSWLRYGQEVSFEVPALPGEPFRGRISYIDPIVREHTRTAKVRVNVDNLEGRLKPGMFVRAVAFSELGPGGVVQDQALAGKWVSPMHPEIVKDEAGACDVCGMPLVRAEELGLVGAGEDTERRPLVVPNSAVLITGRRAVVYVEVQGAERPTFEGREVTLGPRAGDEYIVLHGLEEGERVVVNGAFRIDSSMQIQAKPSMMSMGAETREPQGPAAHLFQASLEPLYAAYLELQQALAGDDVERARQALAALGPALDAPAAAGLDSRHVRLWEAQKKRAVAALAGVGQASDLGDLRTRFGGLSEVVVVLASEFGHHGAQELYQAHCPMAFEGEGGDWLQVGSEIANPYFGADMLRCGTAEPVGKRH